MNLFNRLQGVFFNPQASFKFLSEKPVWIDALIIILIAWAVFSYLITPYSQNDQIMLMESSSKLQERVGEENYQKNLDGIKNPPKWKAALGYVLAPVTLLIGLLISSLILLVIGRLGSPEGKFVQVLSAYLHANFIDKILGNAVRLFLILSRKSVFHASASLAMFFPKLEVTSLAFLILSQFDFFQLWLFGALAFALSYIFKIEIKKAIIISYTFWLIKSLLYLGMMLLNYRLMGL
jgi:hypothetical protein